MRIELEVGGRVRVVEIVDDHAPPAFGDGAPWRLPVTLDGAVVDVEVAWLAERRFSLRFVATGQQHELIIAPGNHAGDLEVAVGGTRVPVRTRAAGRRGRQTPAAGNGPQRISTPMPGKVVRVLVKPGDEVAALQGVVVVEAMKMENELRATRAGVVHEVLVSEGASVEAGASLVVIV